MTKKRFYRVDQSGNLQNAHYYEITDESELETLLLTHPDFHVKGQTNLEITIFPEVIPGFPVEITRVKEDFGIYDLLVGHLNYRDEPKNQV